MSSIIITAAAMVAGQVLTLLGLWLRLRSQVQQEHAHGRLLVDVLRVLPRGGQVHDQRADGARLTVTVTADRENEGCGSG